MSELQMNLPCSTAHWQAETAQAWVALHPWAESPPTKSLRSQLETFSLPNSQPKETPDAYHGHIAAIMLTRSMWDL